MASNLQTARERLGLTQQELAVLIGRDQPTVSRYESGKLRPDIDVAPELANVLGLSVLEVLYPPSNREAA